jgi:outer membrane receptor for ferrienterochelin and colicins
MKCLRVSLGGVGLWSLLLAGAASAQQVPPATDVMDLSLEQLTTVEVDRVYGASKTLQEVTEAPASITVVKAREIREHGYQTLADILRNVRGLYVTYDRNYSYLGVRGFNSLGDYNSRVLLLIDGHRTNDNVYDGTYIGTEFPLDVALIDRVEVVRGPGSSLYGTSAFLTVINVVTKDAAEADGLEVDGMIGSLESQKGRATFAHRTDGGLGIVASASMYSSGQASRLYFPEFDTPGDNGGYAENLDRDQYRQAFAKVSFGDLTVQAVYGWRHKRLPTGAYGTIFNDPSSYTLDTRGFVNALYGRQLDAQTRLVARLYVDAMGYSGDYPYADESSERIVERDTARGRWWGSELMLSRKWARHHTLTGGLEFRGNLVQEQSAFLQYADGSREELVRDKRTSSNWAVYGQDEYRFGKPLAVTVGVRHDHYSTFGGSTNGRVALVYTPAPRTAIKVLRGTAFRAPSVFELYYNIAGGNPDLKPEKIATSEVVWEQYVGAHVRTAATAFQYRVERLIAAVAGAEYYGATFQNSGTVRAKGAELEVEGTWGDRLTARFAQTFQNSEDGDTRQWLTNSPRHLSQVAFRWSPLRSRLTIGYSGQHLGDRRTLAGSLAPGYFKQDLTLTFRPIQRATLLAGLTNLADTRYFDLGSPDHVQDLLGQNGRTFWASASYQF